MTRLNRPRTKLQRMGDQRARSVLHDVVAEMVALREDSGMSRRAVASSAGIAASTLADIEAGRCTPGVEVLARIGSVLGARLVVRFQSGAGPMVRDHLQAAMLQALIRILDPRWRRTLEVAVYQPVRGVIDMVLDDLPAGLRVATEAQSELRRLEQQVRWSRMKADTLAQASWERLGEA